MDIEKIKKDIGKRIKKLREKNKETQKNLAEVIHSTPDNISKIECGRVGLTFDNLILIADHYKVSLDFLCLGIGGLDMLDTLNNYFSLSYRLISDTVVDDVTQPLPLVSVYKTYFDYLVKSQEIKNLNSLPEDLKEHLINHVSQEFNDSLIHNANREIVCFIPVKESIVLNDPNLFNIVTRIELKNL